jgi:hypothetical protein
MATGGRMSLAEPAGVPPGPASLLPDGALEPPLARKVSDLEQVALAQEGHPFDGPRLERLLEDAGFTGVEIAPAEHTGELRVTPGLLGRWFGAEAAYRSALAAELSSDEVELVHAAVRALVGGPPRPWPTKVLYALGSTAP